MGGGSYTAADWSNLRSNRNLHSRQMLESIFSSHTAGYGYHSKNVGCRFSCDPDGTAETTPVIIGFDVTASMGYLAKELATRSLHSTVMALLANEQISLPQVLCAAIGDCKSDEYPLQVTQFEADIRIIRQLLDLYLEGGGGGNGGESYNLLWYFAARHTQHDHFNKRNEKGYLFTIGNDFCHSGLTAAELRRNFTSWPDYNISNEELILEVRKKYHVFHIHIEAGRPVDEEILRQWNRLIPGCCAPINEKDIACLPELITTIISVFNGMSHNAALKRLEQSKAEQIARSVATIYPPVRENVISF